MSDSQLHVLHISTEKGWRGGEQQVAYLIDGLIARGHTCHILSPPDAELFKKHIHSAGERMILHPLKTFGEMDVLTAARIVKLVRRHGIHLIHAQTSHAHSLAWLAAGNLPKTPIVVSRRVDFRVGSNLLSKRKYQHKSMHYIAISNAVKSVLSAAGIEDERIRVVHSGIDPARFPFRGLRRDEQAAEAWDVPKGMPLILNVAALTDHKDQATLLRAAALLKSQLPKFRLIIAGSGELESELKALAEELGLADCVRFAGYVSQLAPLYAAADLFVMSSHLEGLCTSILDAMSAGVPVAAAAAGGIPEIVRDHENGILVPPRNPEELARGMIMILSDPELQRKCIEAGRSTVERGFTHETMVEGTLQVYHRVLEGAGK